MEKIVKSSTFKKGSLIFAIVIFGLFWLKSYVYLDPDFGYRLVNGQKLLSQGFSAIRQDTFSYTMTGYPFVEHSWLTAVIIAILYKFSGMFGTSFVFSALSMSALLIAASINKSNTWPRGNVLTNPFFLLASAIILTYTGVRVQVVSWFFLSALLFVGLNDRRWKKYRFIVPLMLLLWANMHASFVEGFAILSIIVFFKVFPVRIEKTLQVRSFNSLKNTLGNIWKNHHFDFTDIAVWIAAFLATLINPYGLGAWMKVLRVAADSSLRWQIAEWKPLIFTPDLAWLTFVPLTTFLAIRYYKKLKTAEIFVFLLVLFQALGSQRHLPLLVIVSLPIINASVAGLINQTKNLRNAGERFAKVMNYFWIGCFFVLLFESLLVINSALKYRQSSYYPAEALVYLGNNLPEGRIFSTYEWGGYLIWKFPQKRIFVSGAMPVWRWEETNSTLSSAYETYYSMLLGETDYIQVFDKFNIDTVLWHSKENIRQSPLSLLLKRFGLAKESFDFLGQLESDGWKKTYDDGVSVIYRKPS
jgi:hypothetical protein